MVILLLALRHQVPCLYADLGFNNCQNLIERKKLSERKKKPATRNMETKKEDLHSDEELMETLV